MEFTLLFAALTAIGSGWVTTRLTIDQPDRSPVGDLLMGAGFAGLVTGRLASMLIDGVNPLTNPAGILIIRAGVDTGFATLGALGYALWTTRLAPRLLDLAAAPALAALAGWHGGCLWRGTCLGTPTDLPWGWSQTGSGVTRHPVEIYTAIALVIAALIIHRLPRRPFLPAGAALFAAATIRLVTEPLRPKLGQGPIWWYVAGVAIGVAAVSVGARKTPESQV